MMISAGTLRMPSDRRLGQWAEVLSTAISAGSMVYGAQQAKSAQRAAAAHEIEMGRLQAQIEQRRGATTKTLSAANTKKWMIGGTVAVGLGLVFLAMRRGKKK